MTVPEPVQTYPVVVDGSRQRDLMSTLIEIGGPETIWEPPQYALLWLADYSCALHVMMAVDGVPTDDRPLVRIEMDRRREAEEFLARVYPDQPYRWIFNVTLVFPSAQVARRFSASYRRHVKLQLRDPITADAAMCVMNDTGDL